VHATVIKQYIKSAKTKNDKVKTYQVLKLKADEGFSFYTTLNINFPHAENQKLHLEIFPKKLSFYNYFTSFYAYSKVLDIDKRVTLKQSLNSTLLEQHESQNIANIYQALYTASPLSRELQVTFSALGVSHLLAISGFHLGVLSALLFFLLKQPYKLLQGRYFPYRNSKSDLFIIVAVALLSYLLFLDSPDSLLRAFAMLIIGFILYDRGMKIVSMQTLLLTALILLSFFPRLLFSLGFWLSMSGVFYIFLFLIHFKHLNKYWQFVLLPFWVYIMMLPFSLAIFGTFSIYHPLSILWTSVFTLFYPLSILLHIVGFGNLLDGVLESFTQLSESAQQVALSYYYLSLQILLSFIAIYKKLGMWILLVMSFGVFTYAVLSL
jgi:competence protein ComEC